MMVSIELYYLGVTGGIVVGFLICIAIFQKYIKKGMKDENNSKT